MKTLKQELPVANRRAFTLIELLVVISIMALLAAFIFPVLSAVHRSTTTGTAMAELREIQGALENYKAKYGSYPPSNPAIDPKVNTLYYELSGVTYKNAGQLYTTLDGAASITGPNYTTVFGPGISGVMNCTKGGAEEGTAAQNFLPALHANRLGTSSTMGPVITNLVTSVRGPDDNYAPLATKDVNPFRYSYPGTNNPSSYDLWVQLKISGKMYLVCNWSAKPVIGSPLP